MLRSHRLAIVASLVFAVFVLCAAHGRAAGGNVSSPPAPGRYTLTIETGGHQRQALLYIPKGFKAGDKLPLVLALHGAGGDGGTMLDKCGWAATADDEGFLVLAPDGLPAMPRQPSRFLSNPRL